MSEAVNGNPDTVAGGRVPGQRARKYDASRRRAAAAQTRAHILDTARELFVTRGYAATTVAEIARRAGVVPDTVYTAVGRKPALFRELIELALSGTDRPVPGARRDYVARMRAEIDARRKLAVYAEAVTAIQGRLAPLFLVLRDAAAADADLRGLWDEITRRRADNMRLLAADLASTGATRTDLTIDEIADIVWTMNSSEYYSMLVTDRGWSEERFAQWLLDAWCRLLLVTPAGP
ncbi:TetR family transcriptional regulator [Gordonia jinghuaiqii]|uniref:TetR/AcrR family transcriptional regulator n=1 Tax=Gordonia jinghuaiqii TaxID=2758710 RepID=A0A7D7LU46_9ACTN|nr:TetR/AcrR family transcriptional regulator [Gordonia jinghuaiqii]MCR5976232.1 TetR family transcriptional regulator [Gordonia jinghuaiqii]QMT03465.1 TetR/AcrR family transcriptional regulator [Gordonia jinghuaiqii]